MGFRHKDVEKDKIMDPAILGLAISIWLVLYKYINIYINIICGF